MTPQLFLHKRKEQETFLINFNLGNKIQLESTFLNQQQQQTNNNNNNENISDENFLNKLFDCINFNKTLSISLN